MAAQRQLEALRSDGWVETGPRLIGAGENRRLNDGAVDPAGRYLVGTLAIGGGSRTEALLRWECDGSITVIDDDLTLSNGIAWSSDGGYLYSVDTLRRVVYRRAYDVAGSALGEREPWLVLDDGYPDGIAVDADDHVWVAVWGAGEVRRFAPDATLDRRIAVPAPHTSSVAFAGDDLCTLIVTTARDELSEDQLRRYPASGLLFTGRVDVPGLPPTPWTPVDGSARVMEDHQ